MTETERRKRSISSVSSSRSAEETQQVFRQQDTQHLVAILANDRESASGLTRR